MSISSSERSVLTQKAESAIHECRTLLTQLKDPSSQSKPGPLAAVRTFKQLFAVQSELEGSDLPIADSVNSFSTSVQHKLIAEHQMSKVYAKVFQSKLETFTQTATRLVVRSTELSPSDINEAANLIAAYEAYQEAALFFQFESDFHSPAMDVMKEVLETQLFCRQMAVTELQSLSTESHSVKASFDELMSIRTPETFLAALPKFLEQYQAFHQRLSLLANTPENQEYAKETFRQLEQFHASIENCILTDLQTKIDVANEMLTIKANQELIQRTAVLGHDHNQYEHMGAGTACSGHAIATLHQLLVDPNQFLDGGRTFNQTLDRGVTYYDNVVAVWNQQYTNSQYREEISEQLQVAFRAGGLEGVAERLQTYYAKFDMKLFMTSYMDENDGARLAKRIMSDPNIRFTRTQKDFFNFSEGASDIARTVMTSAGSGNVYLAAGKEHLPGQGSYYDFLNRLKLMSEGDGKPVGAVIHIGMFIFSVSVNADGSVFIADSHGIGYINTPGTQRAPFSILLARNIEDGAKLLALHHKGPPEDPNLRELALTNPQQAIFARQKHQFPYYIYRAKAEEGFKVPEAIHTAWGSEKRFPGRFTPPPSQSPAKQQEVSSGKKASIEPTTLATSTSISATTNQRTSSPMRKKQTTQPDTKVVSSTERRSSTPTRNSSYVVGEVKPPKSIIASRVEEDITPNDLLMIVLSEFTSSEKEAQYRLLEELRIKLSVAQRLQQEGKRCPVDLSSGIHSLVDALEINIKEYYQSESKKVKTLAGMIATVRNLQQLLQPVQAKPRSTKAM